MLILACVGLFVELTARIADESTHDDPRPADMILVMGAAEYRGTPSPILKARLNHALELYQRGLAPIIMTTGGAGGDPQFTEGAVGRSYLTDRGVPPEAVVVENEGSSTAYTIASAAETMKMMNLRSCILVSDGYHIYRAKSMMQARGIVVFGSPRSVIPSASAKRYWLYVRQAVGYILWKIGVSV